jgi:hypothetical protein
MALLLLAGNYCYAQRSDAALWMSMNAEKKITKGFSVSLAAELRMNNNITEVGTYFTELGLNYRFSKKVRLSGNYRFMVRSKNDGTYSNRHRYYFDLAYREKIKSVTVSFRTRFQSQYADIYSSAEGKIPEYYLRNKLTIKYAVTKKVTPYISAELFTPLCNVDGITIDNVRYSGGVEYEFSRAHTLDLFYMLQQEYNVKNTETDHIIGIGYYFTF